MLCVLGLRGSIQQLQFQSLSSLRVSNSDLKSCKSYGCAMLSRNTKYHNTNLMVQERQCLQCRFRLPLWSLFLVLYLHSHHMPSRSCLLRAEQLS